MKNLIKFYILSFFILSDFIAFAQADSGGEPVEGGDLGPAAPIDSKLILLAIAGVCFVIYYFRKNKIII